MHVFNSLFPIFALVAIGAVMRRRGFLPEAFFTNASRLVYRLGLPVVAYVFEGALTGYVGGCPQAACLPIGKEIVHEDAFVVPKSPGHPGDGRFGRPPCPVLFRV